MRIGMIGTGHFAGAHAESLKRLGAHVAACYGTNREKTAAFAAAHGSRAFENPLDLVSRRVIDVLYIVVPPFALDGTWERAAIREGVPFLCEKPVSLNLKTARAVAAEVERNGLATASGFWLRAGRTAAAVKQALARNSLSLVRSCRMQGLSDKPWLRRMATSGGMMVEMGIHTVDFMRWTLGEIRSVQAVTSSGINAARVPECDVYDSMDAQITFESGLIGDLAVSEAVPPRAGKLDFLDAYGNDFMLTYLGLWTGDKVRCKEGAADWVEWTLEGDRMDVHNKKFLDAAARSDPALMPASYPDAVRSLEVVLAMNTSAATGRRIEIAAV